MEVRRGRWVGGLALLLPVVLWAASIAALLQALKANEVANGLLARAHGAGAVRVRGEHLQGLAVMWAFALAGLQIAAGAGGGRGVAGGVHRLRAAVCFAVSGGAVILLNAAWLLGLLVWLRVYGETR